MLLHVLLRAYTAVKVAHRLIAWEIGILSVPIMSTVKTEPVGPVFGVRAGVGQAAVGFGGNFVIPFTVPRVIWRHCYVAAAKSHAVVKDYPLKAFVSTFS